MSYKEFIQTIQEEIRKNVPASNQVILSTVIKNNDNRLDAISISTTADTVVPNIYLNQYYEEYQSGRELSSIIQLIMKQCKDCKEREKESIPDISDFNSIADLITYRLVNWNMNLDRLRKLPYKDIEDLVVIYYLVVKCDSSGIESIVITDELLEKWNVSVDEIDKHASKNTQILFPAYIRGMKEVINELVCNGMPDKNINDLSQDDYDEFINMFNANQKTEDLNILTNDKSIYGASSLLYPNVLHDFAVSVNTNIFILPSSVHECILVPDNGKTNKEVLKEMVKEVNCSQVSAEEVLSNEIYYYNRFTDEFHIV